MHLDYYASDRERNGSVSRLQAATQFQQQRPHVVKVEKETMIALSQIFPGLSFQINAPDKKKRR